MEIKHIQKNIHTTPRKLRLVTEMVRRLRPEEALRVLDVTNKAAALDLSKAIKTALANAKVQNQEVSNLQFQTLEVNEGLVMKRFRAGARGRVKRYKKRTSQIRIVLTDRKQESIIKDNGKRKEVVVDNSAVQTKKQAEVSSELSK